MATSAMPYHFRDFAHLRTAHEIQDFQRHIVHVNTNIISYDNPSHWCDHYDPSIPSAYFCTRALWCIEFYCAGFL